MPLTPNGKIDRRALPDPGEQQPASRHARVAPRTPTEHTLAAIWKVVLGIEQVGVDDNFFDLGGHSLLATKVIARVRRTLGVELPLRAIFATPTIAGLAATLDEGLWAGSRADAPALRPLPRTAPLPLAFAQERLRFLDHLEPGHPAYNIPSMIRLRGRLDAPALERALTEIVARHESLRTTFGEDAVNGEPVDIVLPAAAVGLIVVEFPRPPWSPPPAAATKPHGSRKRRRVVRSISQGPLVRMALLRLSAEDNLLLLVMHHIVSDGWSLGVLTRELTALYGAFLQGRESPLPALRIQYADYAQWQRQLLQGAVLESEVAFWKGQLAGAPPSLELPFDRPRPAMQTSGGARHQIVCAPEAVADLRRFSQAEGVTLFMTLLAGFQALLALYSGQHDISIGAPIAGRTHVELEGLIGFFANTLVLRTDLSGSPPPGSWSGASVMSCSRRTRTSIFRLKSWSRSSGQREISATHRSSRSCSRFRACRRQAPKSQACGSSRCPWWTPTQPSST